MADNRDPGSDMSDPIMAAIGKERARQDRKWGEQNYDDLYWLGILMEEAGEVSKSIIEGKPAAETRIELVQTAAVCVAWLECMRRRLQHDGEEHDGEAEHAQTDERQHP